MLISKLAPVARRTATAESKGADVSSKDTSVGDVVERGRSPADRLRGELSAAFDANQNPARAAEQAPKLGMGADPSASFGANDVRGYLNPQLGFGINGSGAYVFHHGGNPDNGQGAGARFYFNSREVELYVTNGGEDIWSVRFGGPKKEEPAEARADESDEDSAGETTAPDGSTTDETSEDDSADDTGGSTESGTTNDSTDSSDSSDSSDSADSSDASDEADSSDGTEGSDGADGAGDSTEGDEEGAAERSRGAGDGGPSGPSAVPDEIHRLTQPGHREPEDPRDGGGKGPDEGCGNGEHDEPTVPEFDTSSGAPRVEDHLPRPPPRTGPEGCFGTDHDFGEDGRNPFDDNPVVNPGG